MSEQKLGYKLEVEDNEIKLTKMVGFTFKKNSTTIQNFFKLFGKDHSILHFALQEGIDLNEYLEFDDIVIISTARINFRDAYLKHRKALLSNVDYDFMSDNDLLLAHKQYLQIFMNEFFVLAVRSKKTEVVETDEALIEHANQLV